MKPGAIDLNVNPLPEEVQELVTLLLEGRVASLIVLAEIKGAAGDEGSDFLAQAEICIEDHTSNVPALIGYLEVLKRDLIDGWVIPLAEDFDSDDPE